MDLNTTQLLFIKYPEYTSTTSSSSYFHHIAIPNKAIPYRRQVVMSAMSLSTVLRRHHRLWLAFELHHRQYRCRPCGHFEVVVAIVVAVACACTHRAPTVISSHYGQRGLAPSRGRGDLGREVLSVTEKRKIGFVAHIRYAGGKRNEDILLPLGHSAAAE